MFKQALIFVTFLMSAHALTRLRPLKGDVEHVQIDQIHDRVQRSVGDGCQFPFLLRFRFEVNGTEIIFNLQKNDHIATNVPLFVMKDGQLVKKETQENNNFALYQDPNRGSAMLVSCEDDGTFRLHGSFYHNGELFHMSPSNVPELSHKHYIQRNGPNENRYLHDAVIPPLDLTDESTKSENATRKKRQTSEVNIVELLIATDVSIYNYFLDDQGTENAAEVAIQQYMALLLNEIDLHYISVAMVDPTIQIRPYLAGVIISKTASEASWSTSSQAVRAGNINGQIVTKSYISVSAILNNIRAWRATQNEFPQHDHMMAMSMVDLADFSSNPVRTGVEGVAYLNTVCNSNYKVSFTEVDGSRVSLVAAHELGHGLGSNHDGQSGSSSASCSSEANNIMTAVGSTTTSLSFAEAQWTFSQCSVAAFKTFINRLSNNCMLDHDFSSSTNVLVQQQQQQLPGEVYSLNQQCQMYGSTSSCQSTISDSACYRGYECSTTQNGCGGPRLYPLAGTPCGSSSEDKWCYRGLCVARTVIATTTTTTDSTTSSTTSTTSSTTSTTSSTSSTTTSTTPSTTSTTPSTTSTTPSTTSTTPSTTSTTPSTTSTTPSTTSTTPSTTSTTPSTTSTTPSTTSTTSSTTSTTPSTTTSTTPSTTTTACTNDKCCKNIWIGWRWKKYCCRGEDCCRHSWARETTCYSNCCSVITTTTTTVTTVSPYCSKLCCIQFGWVRVCCIGNDCCQQSWGQFTSCCLHCPQGNGNGNNTSTTTTNATPTTTTTTAATTTTTAATTTTTSATTTEACYRGKCCVTKRKGRKVKKRCCKGSKCCRKSWARDSVCCRTCK